jgi:hypothetical protein
MRGGKRKGAGRKLASNKFPITVRLEIGTILRFKLYCHLSKLSQARAFERLVRDAVLPNTTLSHAGTSARKQDGAATGVGSGNS